MLSLNPAGIIYVQVENKRCYIVTGSGYYTVYNSLSNITKPLPQSQFFRIHRSATVNMDFVKSFTEKSVTMENGNTLPLSRYRSKAFFDAFSKYISHLS